MDRVYDKRNDRRSCRSVVGLQICMCTGKQLLRDFELNVIASVVLGGVKYYRRFWFCYRCASWFFIIWNVEQYPSVDSGIFFLAAGNQRICYSDFRNYQCIDKQKSRPGKALERREQNETAED